MKLAQEQVLAARKLLGMTQEQLTAAMGVHSYRQIIEWEKGRRSMNPMNQEKLRQLLRARGLEMPEA